MAERRERPESKHVRRVKRKLAARIAGYEAVPMTIKKGYRRPGSQNLRRH